MHVLRSARSCHRPGDDSWSSRSRHRRRNSAGDICRNCSLRSLPPRVKGKGVGLGLAVVYGIVQAHDGDIEVQSKVGEGTVFRVTLPVEPVRAAPAAVPSDAGTGPRERRCTSSRWAGLRKTF